MLAEHGDLVLVTLLLHLQSCSPWEAVAVGQLVEVVVEARTHALERALANGLVCRCVNHQEELVCYYCWVGLVEVA